ncbi:hypothetical protein [Streptomyces sp. NPDC096012]|uniref:hypothetical protein n=1 Tax=Streptomyces sp. NPDC096012 TaxID=3155684 RepID=UPI00336AADA5
MNTSEVVRRPRRTRVLWCLVGTGAAGALSAGARIWRTGRAVDGWVIAGLLLAVAGAWALYRVTGPAPRKAAGTRHRTLRGRRDRAVPLGAGVLLLLLLAAAALVASCVADATKDERAWRAAVPCPAGAPASGSDDCLRTLPAVVERTEVHGPRQRGRLYFSGGRPLAELAVSYEAARAFEAGDPVELTVWRGEVMKVAGAHHVWHEHVVTGGSVAVLAAGLALAAGFPGAQVLLRLRGRRRPDDEVLPSALPYAGALAGTGAWLLPLCYRHPTTLFGSGYSVTWLSVGSLVTLGLFAGAWRATRIRAPGLRTPVHPAAPRPPSDGEVFVPARFLEDTAYNPHGFGTHIVLGEGGPAVTPHPGPGRFAARRIPVERLTVKTVRRVRGADGDTVPRGWHIAELDDAGTPVRLAAAPDDLARLLRALVPART